MKTLNQKLDQLQKYIAETGKNGVAIAFSGGVDSTTLAAITYQLLNKKSIAIIARSPIHPSNELQTAKKTAKKIGIKLYMAQTNVLTNPSFIINSENRCYHCKKELITNIKHIANQIGITTIFEGTNYSDLNEHRPGIKAIYETPNVFSPWITTQMSKNEIRQIAKQLGLDIYNKPPLACLATRIPFNQLVTEEKLIRIDKAEQVVQAITNIRQVRVRDHQGLARIEVPKSDFPLVCNVTVWSQITKALLKLGFKYVTLDLQGYVSGSMIKTLTF
ncbi:MAG: ATP-dependent sacrificial sulfur transferase LarE [Nitrososphaerota archaeon]|jgi:uncharacterized protein|nr:ATP-dependent sacrificial sulfur transferase LarE [Nitrososphaerota archaeon]